VLLRIHSLSHLLFPFYSRSKQSLSFIRAILALSLLVVERVTQVSPLHCIRSDASEFLAVHPFCSRVKRSLTFAYPLFAVNLPVTNHHLTLICDL
jgi:hypothetical protein